MVTKKFLTHFYYVLILVGALFFICGCQKEDPIQYNDSGSSRTPVEEMEMTDPPLLYNAVSGLDTPQYDGGYIYFPTREGGVIGGSGKVIMYRYRVATGEITYVCSDPLCDHETPNCPLFGMAVVHIKNGIFRGTKMYSYTEKGSSPPIKEKYLGYVSFDVDQMNLRELKQYFYDRGTNPQNFPAGMLYGRELHTDQYRFYTDHVVDEATQKRVKQLFRMNVQTGDVVSMAPFSQGEQGEGNGEAILELLFHINDRVYFSNGNGIYSSNFDFTDQTLVLEAKIEATAFTNGRHIIWQDTKNGQIYMANLDGSDRKQLPIEVGPEWCTTGKYLYYESNDVAVWKSNTASKESHFYGKEIRRYCYADGTDQVVFTFDEKYSETRLVNWIVVDDTIYGYFSQWNRQDLDDGYYVSLVHRGTNQFFKIDISNGNASIVDLKVE